MAWEAREGDGTLFKTKEKRTDKSPDYWGTVKLNGATYKIAGWVRKSDGKPPFVSLRIELDTRGEEPQPASPQTEDDDLPF